jgi:hypothetical protein
MVRIYRYLLVVVLVALIAWGIWYVISHYQEQSTYEDGVLVRIEAEVVQDVKCLEREGKDMTYGTGYSIH